MNSLEYISVLVSFVSKCYCYDIRVRGRLKMVLVLIFRFTSESNYLKSLIEYRSNVLEIRIISIEGHKKLGNTKLGRIE